MSAFDRPPRTRDLPAPGPYDPEQLRQIDAPLLGIFAKQDTSITPAIVDAFDAALDTADVSHTIDRYDAFANFSSARYDHENATDAWAKVQAFLATHLR